MNTSQNRDGIVTARLVLRRLRPNDAGALAALANNVNIAQMTARLPHPYTHDDAVSFIAGLDRKHDSARVYAITTANDGAFLGCCGVEPQDGHDNPMLGYWLGEPYWCKGYATEAARALVDGTFDTTDIGAIHSGCRVINTESRRVLQKCGFRYTETGTSYTRALDETVPVERFRLDRQTWLSLHGGSGLEQARRSGAQETP